MNSKLIIIILTIIVIFLLGAISGLIIGKQNGNLIFEKQSDSLVYENQSNVNENLVPQKTPTQTSGDFEPINNLPIQSEWIQINEDGISGYSLYIENKMGGLVIFEECQSFLYVDKDGKPSEQTIDFNLCPKSFWSHLINSKGNTLTLNSKDNPGQIINAQIFYSEKPNPSLKFTFDNKTYLFRLGSRNDLNQHFENQPSIIKAKEALYKFKRP